jgi:probable F420-dependent oxidoreductase
MPLELGRFGVWRRVAEITPVMAAELERMGYGAVWIGGSPRGHLEEVEHILAATERIPVVTGIVNMWREDAVTVGHSYLRIIERYPDRFVLGVGIGHPESTSEFTNPLNKIVEYLDQLDEVGVPRKRTVLAALGPRVLRLAAERTAGAHPYLTTPRHTELARGVLGEGPLLAPEQKVVLEKDADRARSAGRPVVSRYLRLSNYRNNLIREGWAAEDLVDDGSDRLIDALVLHGESDEVAEGLRAHVAAGADHVGIQAVGEDSVGQYRALASVLFD